MKKILFSFLGLFLAGGMAFAGGLVTNTNQSAAWARMLVRDASTSIDAVYHNPAGLTKLSDGLHLSVSNQSIFQKRKISNSAIPNTEYEGKVTAPFFPNVYAAYKTGKFAFSVGFAPIGGGGSAKFDAGIPMTDGFIGNFIASNPGYSAIAGALGTTMSGAFSSNSNIEGSSVYFGFQGGISYAITDMISAYVGARYVMAKNSTKISITGIELYTANPNIVFTEAFLTSIGQTAAAAGLGDLEVDAEQTGNGFAPILGLNLALMEDALNIGIKYEFQTNMEIKNKTNVDDTGFLFPDGEKTNADIPALLSIGVNYKFSDVFSAQVGYHTYFDKNAGWATIEGSNPEISVIDNNYWELGVGFEFNVSEQLLLSAGYLRAQTGVNDYYQNDMSYSLSSNTFGLGGAYQINDMLTLQLGGYYTKYGEETIPMPEYNGLVSQTYNKNNLAFAIGLDFTFGGGK